MTSLDSLEQLTDWERYLAFTKARLSQLPAEASDIFVSKQKLTFTDGGKEWKGHAVLVGPKGAQVVRAVQKEGVHFFAATCTAAGKDLAVDGIGGTYLKEAARTLKRTRLGYKIAGVEDDDEAEAGNAKPAPRTATAPTKSGEARATTDRALLSNRLDALLQDIERVAATVAKEREPFAQRARARAKEAQAALATDPVKAAKLIQEGEEFARLAAAGDADGPDRELVAQIEAQRQVLLAEWAEAKKLAEPANDAIVAQVGKALEAVLSTLGQKDYPKAQALLEAVEAQLALLVEGPEPTDDPDLTVLGDWAKYRAFLRAQIKRIGKEGSPVFISRQPAPFTIKGVEWQGHAILVGPKARAAMVALKREGMQFMEGAGKVEGVTIAVSGIKKSLLKAAGKTMIKLRAGKRLVADGFLPPEDDNSDVATDGSTGKRALDKQVKELADSLVTLRAAIDKQKGALPAMTKDAQDKRKRADELTAAARKASDDGKDTTKDWDDAAAATTAADAAHFAAKAAQREAGRAENDLREMVERLRRIRDSADADAEKRAQLKKLKADIAAKQLDVSIANLDPADPKAGKLIANQIEKRFGVKLKLNQTTITGRDADGNQVFKDNDKKIDPKKEAETLKELYLTLSKAPVFPESHLKKITVSLRPSNSESEGGVYFESSKTAEITCRRPKESFNYGDQLNSRSAFPDGVEDDCKAANNDPVNYFDWATLHEVAHAVDAKYKFMSSRQAGSKYGAWVDYGTNPAPIATVLANHFGGGAGVDKKKLEQYALQVLKAAPKGGPAPTTPEQTSVKNWVDAVRHTEGLWWDGGKSNAQAIGNRIYHESYEGGWWISYDQAARKQGIHGYQFRAPGEWFAELYAAYYSDKLKPSHPIVADLTQLEAPR